MEAGDVEEATAAAAAPTAPVVPRLDLSDLVDASRPSATQLAMKSALESDIGDAPSIESSSTSTTPEMSMMQQQRPISSSSLEQAQAPSTPTSSSSPRADSAPVVVAVDDSCSICAESLGSNGGKLSLLCGECFAKSDGAFFFFAFSFVFFFVRRGADVVDLVSFSLFLFFSSSSFRAHLTSLSPPNAPISHTNPIPIRPPLLLPLHPPLAQAVPPLPDLP